MQVYSYTQAEKIFPVFLILQRKLAKYLFSARMVNFLVSSHRKKQNVQHWMFQALIRILR